MKPFGGFPARMEFTPVPNLFFSRLLAEIDDPAELKTLLCVFQAIYGKRGSPRFTTYNELAANTGLMTSLGGGEKSAVVLHTALAMAEKRGTILHLALDREGKTEDVYLLNTPAEQQVRERIKNGELKLPDLTFKEPACPETAAVMPDIFTVYEENIGLLTPMIADELREAEKLYPEAWLRDAVKRAVEENKRKWSYIQAILERWTREGKGDGTHQKNPGKTDPNKYIKQKYGHMVQR